MILNTTDAEGDVAKQFGGPDYVHMAIVLKVKWVEKADAPKLHQRIRSIGGDSGEMRWKHAHADAVESIERGLFAYYVELNARAVRLDVACAADGSKYLSVPAGQSQMLLELPAFPAVPPTGAAAG